MRKHRHLLSWSVAALLLCGMLGMGTGCSLLGTPDTVSTNQTTNASNSNGKHTSESTIDRPATEAGTTPTEGLAYTNLTSLGASGHIVPYYLVAGIGTATDTDIIIPETYKGLPVRAIRYEAFKYCYSITSVAIPDSVTSIGDEAFANCENLTSIEIPDSVTSIGDEAFADCSNLTSITIPSGVTSIGDSAFSFCSSLTSITIPDGVTSIGDSAFNCSSLTSITIPDGVTSIGDSAFDNCSSLTSITVEQGNSIYHSSGNCLIETESKTLIAGCKNSIIPTDGSVTSIGSGAFSYCESLTNIEIPNGVISIEDGAFANCENLTSIEIPDSVKSIGDAAFYYCGNLTSITIPDGVTSIGDNTFYNCDNLNVTIPASVTSIGESAFGGISASITINFQGSVARWWQAIEKADNWIGLNDSYIIYCTDGTVTPNA